ncbi:MAG: sodium:solute symporter [Gammaproteobacteria bacterium]
MNVHLILLLGYTALLFGLGLLVARRVRGSADFFVAGRALSAPLLMSTILAANIGAGATVGATGLAFSDGVSAWWWNGSAAIGSLALAFWVGPRIWRLAAARGFLTVGDFLEHRYHPIVRALVAALIWIGTLAILAAQLIAGAAVLEVVAGVPRMWGVLIGAAAMLAYFTGGGLLASAWVNAVQLVVLLAGLLLAVPLVVAAAGGWRALATAGPPGYTDVLHVSGPGGGIMLLALLAPAFIVSPGLLQKVFGARDVRAVRLGVGLQALVLAVFACVPVIFGMAARVLVPEVASPNLVLPTVLVEALPLWLSALALAAIFSAEVSTCDAILFMLSTSLSQDLYRRFLRPQASDAAVLRMARWAALLGAAAGVAIALVVPTFIGALSVFYTLLGVSLFVPVLAGLYLRGVGVPEALAAIAGGVTFVLAQALRAEPGTALWDHPNVGGLVCAALALLLVAAVRRVTRRPPVS